MRRSATGARVFSGVAARVQPVGDGLQYPTGPEYRDRAGLEELCKQLPGKPVTLNHPDGLVSRGAPARVIGRILSARLDGDLAHVEIEVHDEAAARAIEQGLNELSVGYECKLDADRFQRNIIVDHLAVVPRARCGPTCHLDHAHDDALGASQGCGQGCGQGCACKSCAIAYTSLDTAMADVNQMPSQLDVTGHTVMDKTLTAHARHEISAKHFAVPGREALPLEDANHVRDAMARFSQEKFESPAERRAAYHRILARAHELGINASGFAKEHADDDYSGSESSMDGTRKDQSMTTNADNAPGGGQGIAQNPHETGAAAPDFNAKIAAAEAGMKEWREKHDALKAKYDLSLAEQLKSEKERDAGNLRAGMFEKEAAAHKDRADKAEAERDEMKRKLDAAIAELTGAKKRADEADAAAKAAQDRARLDADNEFQARVAERANARADLLTKANAIAGVADRSKLSDREVMCAALKVAGVDITADKTDTYVQARFDALVESEVDAQASRANARQALNQARQDAQDPANTVGGPDAEKNAHAAMAARAASAWVPQSH